MKALALSTVVAIAGIVIADSYSVLSAVGSVPSVVYLISASVVSQASVTLCSEAKEPPAGEADGVATVPKLFLLM